MPSQRLTVNKAAADAGEAHEETKNERGRKAEFGEIDKRIDEIEMGENDVGDEFAVNREGGPARHLLGPIIKSVVMAERQLPQRPLKPHAADRNARRPQPEIGAGALRWILPPVDEEQCDARGHQQVEDQQEEIFPEAEGVEVAGVRGQERQQV